MATLTTRQRNAIDRRVQEIVSARCAGVPIDIMKIGGVFQAAYRAVESGDDLAVAVVVAYYGAAGVDIPEALRDKLGRLHRLADPHCTCTECIEHHARAVAP